MLRHAKIRREPDFCNTIAKNLHKQPQNRHQRRRFADLDDIDSPTSTMSIQRLWKRDKNGFGKVQEMDTSERKLEKYSDTENMKASGYWQGIETNKYSFFPRKSQKTTKKYNLKVVLF